MSHCVIDKLHWHCNPKILTADCNIKQLTQLNPVLLGFIKDISHPKYCYVEILKQGLQDHVINVILHGWNNMVDSNLSLVCGVEFCYIWCRKMSPFRSVFKFLISVKEWLNMILIHIAMSHLQHLKSHMFMPWDVTDYITTWHMNVLHSSVM